MTSLSDPQPDSRFADLALDYLERVTALILVNATGYPEKTVPAGLRLARNPLLRPVLRRAMPRRVSSGTCSRPLGRGRTSSTR